MITTQVRNDIQAIVDRFEAARAAGQTMAPNVLPMYEGAKAALACTDVEWLARAAKEDARGVVTLAANGDLQGNFKLI